MHPQTPFNALLFLILGWFCAANAGLVEASQALPAQAAPEWDGLFERTNGWIGADGSYSVPLSRDTTVWLFSDTFVGEICDGARTNLTMINNSIAIQRGASRPEFFYRTNRQGKPASFVTPANGRGFYWLFHGTRDPHGLHFFLHQTITTKSFDPFGFRLVDCWLASVPNPDNPPPQWRLKQNHVPFTEIATNTALIFGAAVFREGGFDYIYGSDSRPQISGGKPRQGVVLARAPAKNFARFKSWQFFSEGKWQADFRRVTPVCSDVASEFSVSYAPTLRRYVLVHMEGIWGKIVARLASAPTGPWTAPIEIYRCPEMQWPVKPFCYSAKGHPELPASPGALLITYAQNSWEFKYQISEPRLYWPRFVNVSLRDIPELQAGVGSR